MEERWRSDGGVMEERWKSDGRSDGGVKVE